MRLGAPSTELSHFSESVSTCSRPSADVDCLPASLYLPTLSSSVVPATMKKQQCRRQLCSRGSPRPEVERTHSEPGIGILRFPVQARGSKECAVQGEAALQRSPSGTPHKSVGAVAVRAFCPPPALEESRMRRVSWAAIIVVMPKDRQVGIAPSHLQCQTSLNSAGFFSLDGLCHAFAIASSARDAACAISSLSRLMRMDLTSSPP